jgi:hypothetical protein
MALFDAARKGPSTSSRKPEVEMVTLLQDGADGNAGTNLQNGL